MHANTQTHTHTQTSRRLDQIGLGADTAVQLVYNPFSQFISQAQLYSQLQLSLESDPIALNVPTFAYQGLVMIQCARYLPDILNNMWCVGVVVWCGRKYIYKHSLLPCIKNPKVSREFVIKFGRRKENTGNLVVRCTDLHLVMVEVTQ